MTVRITGWEVDGFGALGGRAARDLPDGLLVVSGPNEAGKSTLLDFLRGVLFGFPDGRSRLPRHEPVGGGPHGGRVLLDVDGHAWTVERHASPRRVGLHGPGGVHGGEEELRALLGGADAELYRTVFAFGLAELADLGTLEADAVRERIFSAGVVGAGRSAATAIAQLDKRAAALLTPSGRSGRIRDLERELKLAEGALRAARGEAGTHARARADEEEARDAVVRLRAAGGAVAGEERRARRLVELWPMETARATLTAELAAIPHDPGIDDASEARLERALTQAAAAEEALRVRTAERDAAVAAHDAIGCDDRLAAVAAEVRALARERAAHVERQERLAGLRAARASATGTLQDELARLGPGWDRGRLEAFDASIPTAGQVRGWGDRLARSDAEARQAAAVERERQAAATAARRTLDEARARLAAAGGDDGLDGAEAALRALRSELPEQARREAAAVSAGGSRPPLRAAALAAAGVLAVLAAVLAIGSDAVAAGVALVAAAVVAGLGLLSPRDGGSAGAALARERGAQHVAELATKAGVRVPVDALAVEERAARLAEVRALGTELARAAAAAREAERLAAEAAAQAAATADEAEEALAGWAVEAARLGLPEAPSPDAATDAFTSVARAREALRTLAQAEQVLAAEEARAATFAARVRGVLEAVGEVVAVDDVAAAVERLAELVEADARAREERARHARARDEAARRLREVEEAGAACAARLTVVLDGDDVEGFRARIARARRRGELARSLAEAERQLRATAGAGEDAARLLEELRSGALETWQADVARLSTRRVDLDRQREDAVRRHEKALARLGELEQSADVATHDLACAALREERARAVEAWQRLVIARGLVADTLARFERERQPAVLERAAEHFREVTAGRYERLAVRDGAVDAIDASGRRVDAAVLSRGTREQLYLCLRLGLVAEFSRGGARALPLVLDDVLVNFDPERAQSLAHRLAAVAEEHQVLLLTCHPHVVDLVERVAPAATVIELARTSPIAR